MKRHDASSLKTGSRGPSHPVSGQNRRFLNSSGRHEESQWKLMSFYPRDKSSFQVLVSRAKTAEPVQRRMGETNTYRAHVFLMRILSACLSQPVVTVVQIHAAT